MTLAEGSTEALVDRFDTALLDLDGVVYVGAHAVAGVPESLAAMAQRGMRAAFVTNNASRAPETIVAHLRDLGIPATTEDVVTSAQAAVTLVLERAGAGDAVLVVGGEGLRVALRERGLRPVTSAEDDPVAVVQGYAPEVDWRALAEGTFAVRRGLPWVATNLDATVPTARGLAPGNGALVDVIRATTGATPVAAGKPELALHREAVRRTGARRPLVVGDRLDTDIEGANRAGVASLLVLTGVATPSELIRAGPAWRPSYVAADLRAGLLDPHPTVVEGDGGWRCGGWTAGRDGVLRGAGRTVDAVRAACVAAWSGHGYAGELARAVAELGRTDPTDRPG